MNRSVIRSISSEYGKSVKMYLPLKLYFNTKKLRKKPCNTVFKLVAKKKQITGTKNIIYIFL